MPLKHPHIPRSAAACLVSAACGLTLAPSAQSATTVVAKGAGWGARHRDEPVRGLRAGEGGRTASQILATYYQGTQLSKVDTNRQIACCCAPARASP